HRGRHPPAPRRADRRRRGRPLQRADADPRRRAPDVPARPRAVLQHAAGLRHPVPVHRHVAARRLVRRRRLCRDARHDRLFLGSGLARHRRRPRHRLDDRRKLTAPRLESRPETARHGIIQPRDRLVMTQPLVVVSTDVRQFENYTWHAAPAQYLEAVLSVAGVTPLLVPSFGERLDLEGLLDRVDGVLLTGSKSNVDPTLYGGDASDRNGPYDRDRDATTMPLIRLAIARG